VGTTQPYLLAVDGGNTKTIAVVAGVDGRVVGVGRGGCTDIYGAASLEAAHAELAATVGAALAAASVDARSVAAAVLSLAGADWPEDIAVNAAFARTQLGLRDAVVVNDAIGGLRSGTPDGVGIAVICGTFNAVGARNADGAAFHLGFWPDRTGAVDLSTEALKAVYRHGLDLGPATALTSAVLDLFGVGDTLDLLHSFTRRTDRRSRHDLVRVAPVLLDVAADGDQVAAAIVTSAGRALGDQAAMAATRVALDVDEAIVVLSGGVLQHRTALLADTIMSRLPGAVAVRPQVPPIVGVLMLARDHLGLASDPDALHAEMRRLDALVARR
jgi:N-acetylglucosamine kinase-like BadF-type ATPase